MEPTAETRLRTDVDVLRRLLRRALGCLDVATYDILAHDIQRALGDVRQSTTRRILSNVAVERTSQLLKWGEQNHPDADPTLTGRKGGATAERLAEELEIPTAARAKFLCRTAGDRGGDNWGAILVEELAEAVEAIGDDQALRAELVQVAAVAVAWIEAIDRREATELAEEREQREATERPDWLQFAEELDQRLDDGGCDCSDAKRLRSRVWNLGRQRDEARGLLRETLPYFDIPAPESVLVDLKLRIHAALP